MSTQSVAQRNGKGGAQKPLTADQKGLLLGLITDQPELTDSQVAQQVGISRAAVWKARRTLQPATEQDSQDIDSVQAELERLIGKNLPPAKLVHELGLLICDRKTPKSVKLMAIRTAAELRGIVTRKEKRDAEANSSQPAPIFVFTGMAPSAAPPQVVDQGQDKPALPSISKPDLDKSTG